MNAVMTMHCANVPMGHPPLLPLAPKFTSSNLTHLHSPFLPMGTLPSINASHCSANRPKMVQRGGRRVGDIDKFHCWAPNREVQKGRRRGLEMKRKQVAAKMGKTGI